jgi:hypothetical protein
MSESQQTIIEEQAARIKELETRLARYQEHLFIDATPDGGYAMRILQCYRASCDYVISDVIGVPPTNPLCVEMNKINELRKKELDAAISVLAVGEA